MFLTMTPFSIRYPANREEGDAAAARFLDSEARVVVLGIDETALAGHACYGDGGSKALAVARSAVGGRSLSRESKQNWD
jgi:hypothetical protein